MARLELPWGGLPASVDPASINAVFPLTEPLGLGLSSYHPGMVSGVAGNAYLRGIRPGDIVVSLAAGEGEAAGEVIPLRGMSTEHILDMMRQIKETQPKAKNKLFKKKKAVETKSITVSVERAPGWRYTCIFDDDDCKLGPLGIDVAGNNVVAVSPSSQGDALGVKVGDRIEAVDGVPLQATRDCQLYGNQQLTDAVTRALQSDTSTKRPISVTFVTASEPPPPPPAALGDGAAGGEGKQDAATTPPIPAAAAAADKVPAAEVVGPSAPAPGRAAVAMVAEEFAFVPFAPRRRPGGRYETQKELLARVNKMVAASGIRVRTIETVSETAGVEVKPDSLQTVHGDWHSHDTKVYNLIHFRLWYDANHPANNTEKVTRAILHVKWDFKTQFTTAGGSPPFWGLFDTSWEDASTSEHFNKKKGSDACAIS